MKGATVCLLLLIATPAAGTSPIEKVISMMENLYNEVKTEGEEAHRIYEEFVASVADDSANLEHQIKVGTNDINELNAQIQKNSATISESGAEIDELATVIAKSEAALKKATETRADENAAFLKLESELTTAIDMLQRATMILERELSKAGAGASMLQMKNANSFVDAMRAMIQAEAISTDDAQKLTALLQNDDDETNAPQAAAYESKSGTVLDAIADLTEKAEAQLSTARSAETQALHAFEEFQASSQREQKFANEDKIQNENRVSAAQAELGQNKGDLSTTTNKLTADTDSLDALKAKAMKYARDYEAEQTSRSEELGAIGKAMAVVKEATGGAAEQSYGFLQLSASNADAVSLVRRLAERTNDAALAQLASKMAATLKYSNGMKSADVFAKVKGLIADMITKLEQDAKEDATEKAFCDEELTDTKAKIAHHEGNFERFSAEHDRSESRSAHLAKQVKQLSEDLAELAKAQSKADAIREESNKQHVQAIKELGEGVVGVQSALKILRDYYSSDAAHAKSDGAGNSIINLLEVCESDFSKGLAETQTAEEDEAAAHKKFTQENEIQKATDEADVKHKTNQIAALKKEMVSLKADIDSVSAELAENKKYLATLEDRCIAKPEPFAERSRRREAEIAGLQEALRILEEAALVQTSSRHLRGN